MNKKTTVCIIGLGRMGEAHLTAVLQLGFEVIGLSDQSIDRLVEIMNKFSLQRELGFVDSEVMFTKVACPDLTIIATTANAHCELTCLAAKYKVPKILCEKPMATSLMECDKMIDACRYSGSSLAVNHQMRFMPQYKLVKESITQGQFGRLSSMNVVGGCFGLSMNGSHYIEAFHYMTDSEPVEVTAWFVNEQLPNPRGKQFRDRAGQVRVLSNSGQRLSLEIGSDQGHGMTALYATQYGHIFVDELGGDIHAVARKKEYQNKPATFYGLPNDRWQQQFKSMDNVDCTKQLLSAFMSGDEYPSAVNGRRVVNTLVAAYHSAECGNVTVKINSPELPYEQRFPWA